MNMLFKIFAFPLLFWFSGLLAAEQTPRDDLYTIEIILFAQNAPDSGEIWPDDPGQPDMTRAVDLLTASAGVVMATDSNADFATEDPMRLLENVDLLPTESLQLSPIAYSLQRRGLEPLVHIAWRQAVGKWKSPDWHWIQSGPVRGLLRVTKGRFLHLDMDLLLEDRSTDQQFRVIGQRKMRSGELHHIDHPKLGIIAQIDSYVAPGNDASEEDSEAVEEERPPTPATGEATSPGV